jgi:hypothetical protein
MIRAYLATGLAIALLFGGASCASYNAGIREGEDRERSGWNAAADELREAEVEAAIDAGRKADTRMMRYQEDLEETKRAIDEANSRGDSALDSLFGVREGSANPVASGFGPP